MALTLVQKTSYGNVNRDKIHRGELTDSKNFYTGKPEKIWSLACGSSLAHHNAKDIGDHMIDIQIIKLCHSCFNLKDVLVDVSAQTRVVD